MSDLSWPGQVLALFGRVPTAARVPLGALAAALAAWFVLYAVVGTATRPREVRPGPPEPDLPGDEPPALVNLLVSGCTATEDAAGATLLDLAARGYLELDQPGPASPRTTISLTTGIPGASSAAPARPPRARPAGGGDLPLTAYEQQVLALVTSRATGGVVAPAELAIPDPRDAERWSSRFAASVAADARDRRLVRRRVPGWLVFLLVVAAAAPALVAARLAEGLGYRWGDRAVFAGIVPFVLLAVLAARPRGRCRTAAGRAAAARWLGLRAYLEADPAFAGLPPSAVAAWDRYLPYGSALGVARVASGVLDLGVPRREHVWSSYGGSHQVRVRYPRPAVRYGARVPGLVLSGLLMIGIGYGLLRLYQMVQPSARGLPGPPGGWTVVVAAAGVLLGAGGLYRTVRALLDLVTARTIRGEVLCVAPWRRPRRGDDGAVSVHYLAVDDGTSGRTTAWALPSTVTRGFGPGDVVELTVRPWTRRVTRLGVVRSWRLVAPAAATRPLPLDHARERHD